MLGKRIQLGNARPPFRLPTWISSNAVFTGVLIVCEVRAHASQLVAVVRTGVNSIHLLARRLASLRPMSCELAPRPNASLMCYRLIKKRFAVNLSLSCEQIPRRRFNYFISSLFNSNDHQRGRDGE